MALALAVPADRRSLSTGTGTAALLSAAAAAIPASRRLPPHWHSGWHSHIKTTSTHCGGCHWHWHWPLPQWPRQCTAALPAWQPQAECQWHCQWHCTHVVLALLPLALVSSSSLPVSLITCQCVPSRVCHWQLCSTHCQCTASAVGVLLVLRYIMMY